jgi:EmrB/QacA subfamily drug resistance transporter
MSLAVPAGIWGMTLFVLLVGQFMALVDALIVNVAMPVIGARLPASGAALQLVVGGYIAAYAMFLITGARLGDLYGRRRMYLVGVAGFTLASLLCGLAPNVEALVAFRFAQGAAAAVMVPQIISVIQTKFTGAARARALSAYGLVLSSGAVVGLVLGGLIVNADLFGTGWRPVFLVNVPLGLLLVVLVPRLVPRDAPTGARRLDPVGLGLGVTAVFLIVLPLVLGRSLGWPWWIFAAIAAGVGFGAAFVVSQRRVRDPLVDLSVVRAKAVAPGLSTLAFCQVAYAGFLFVFSLHLQSGLGYGPLRAGLTYLPLATTFGLVGYYWRRLPVAVHPMAAPAGLALCAVSYVVIALAPADRVGAAVWLALAAAGVGLGLSAAPVMTQALVHVPPARAADASGLLTTTVQLSQVVGVAAFGTLYLGSSLSTTGWWLAVVAALGLAAGTRLTAAVRPAKTVIRPANAAVPPGNAVVFAETARLALPEGTR